MYDKTISVDLVFATLHTPQIHTHRHTHAMHSYSSHTHSGSSHTHAHTTSNSLFVLFVSFTLWRVHMAVFFLHSLVAFPLMSSASPCCTVPPVAPISRQHKTLTGCNTTNEGSRASLCHVTFSRLHALFVQQQQEKQQQIEKSNCGLPCLDPLTLLSVATPPALHNCICLSHTHSLSLLLFCLLLLLLLLVLLLCASEYLTHFALLSLLFNAVCTSTWGILAGRDSWRRS